MTFKTNWNSVSFDGAGMFVSGDSRVYNITWGDGVSDRVVLAPGKDANGLFNGNSPVHFYGSDGTYDVQVSQAQAGLPPEHLRAFMYSRSTDAIDIGGSYLSDIITGGTGNDTLNGVGGSDVVSGADGNDRILGGAGDFDFLLGGEGDDIVLGGAGTDLAYGNEGNDIVRGGADQDFVHGDSGDDVLLGDDGDDYLQGDAGIDRMTGGAGADTFVFLAPEDVSGKDPSRDIITDFQQGADTLDVANVAAGFSYIDHAVFSGGGVPEIRSVFSGAGDTIVMGDANGDGTVDFSVRLVGNIELTAGDFNF